MIDIRQKKVKAIYFNTFHCPECGLELHKDNIVFPTNPPQYCYFCDCGFRTTSFQQPGIEYEFENEEYKEIKNEFPTTEELLKKIADKWDELGSSSPLEWKRKDIISLW